MKGGNKHGESNKSAHKVADDILQRDCLCEWQKMEKLLLHNGKEVCIFVKLVIIRVFGILWEFCEKMC